MIVVVDRGGKVQEIMGLGVAGKSRDSGQLGLSWWEKYHLGRCALGIFSQLILKLYM